MVGGRVCTVRKSGVNSCMVGLSETIAPSACSTSCIAAGAVARKTRSTKSLGGQRSGKRTAGRDTRDADALLDLGDGDGAELTEAGQRLLREAASDAMHAHQGADRVLGEGGLVLRHGSSPSRETEEQRPETCWRVSLAVLGFPRVFAQKKTLSRPVCWTPDAQPGMLCP